MEVWAVIVIIILLILVLIMVGLTYWTESQNERNQQRNILYPFSGAIDPMHTSEPVKLTKAPGNKPQLQCPTGYKINIVGAWVAVNDPYGECSNPSATFKATCGDTSDLSSAVSCTDDGDCASGLHCKDRKCVAQSCRKNLEACGPNACPVNVGHKCGDDDDCGGSPMVCLKLSDKELLEADENLAKKHGTCQVDPSQGQCMSCLNGNCAQAPTCSNLDEQTYINKTCDPTNKTYECRPRDASAYLAEQCDGKQVCNFEWHPKSPQFFGPLPCKITPFGVKSVPYATLPIIPGWDGGKPADGDTVEPASFKQGYYVHGIYTCVPEDED